MKKLILAFILIISISFSYAQKVVAVLSGTTWTFYDDFSPALRAAPSSSIIYLPGGTFQISDNNDTINKQLTIIGAGFSLDSAGATGITRLIGNLTLDNGADYTTIEGISLDGIYSLKSSSYYNNILIRRCYVGSVDFLVQLSNYGKNYYITESVICSLRGGSDPWNGYTHYNNLKVEKSIITYYYADCYGAVFNNNILLTYTINTTTYNNACEFNNNIFIDSAFTNEVATNSIYNNNIFRVNGNNWGGGNVYINCTWNKLPNTIFINPSSSISTCDGIYNPQYNFHLKATSPAKNFGTDGTDAGIYGTSSPCKDGWVPSNPHISTKTVGPSSLSNGTLPVNVKVIAQDR